MPSPFPLWAAGPVTAIGANLTLTLGTLSATGGGGGGDWSAGTVTAVGVGLDLTSGTISADWNGGVVSAIGSGLAVAGGTISATGGASDWNAGSVSAIGSNLTLSAGTLNAVTQPQAWNGGTVTTLGDGLALAGGTLSGDWQAAAITTLGTDFANNSGTLNFVGTASSDWNAGTVTAIGSGLDLTSGTISADWNGGVVSAIGTGLTLASGTLSATGGGGGIPGGSAGQVQYNDGSNFAGFWGNAAGPTPPADTAFTTWYNQNSASLASNSNGPLVMSSTQTSAGISNTAKCKNVHAADWTITVNASLGGRSVSGSGSGYPIVVTDGTKFYTFTQFPTSIQVSSWSAINTFNTTHATLLVLNCNPSWYRARYDSATTTITFEWSVDGITWIVLYSTATPYLTATQYGFGFSVRGNTAGSIVNTSVFQFLET